MEHILDNPAWNALNSGNKNLSNGNESAKYFSREVSPFVGIPEPTESNFDTLYSTIPFSGTFGFIVPQQIEFPKPWSVWQRLDILQMIFEKPLNGIDQEQKIIPLNEGHIPAMLELTKLTNPGPFFNRTIDFGHYQGIFDGERLVAMAGQRLHPVPYAEISAVCTHPGYLGKGYARHLLLTQANRIRQANEIPFLHVRTDNDRAVKVYKGLGFEVRREISIYVIKKQ